QEIGIGNRYVPESRQRARPGRTLEGADEDPREREPLEPIAQAPCVALAALRQGNVGPAGVLTGQAPRRLTVTREVDDRQRAAHALACAFSKMPTTSSYRRAISATAASRVVFFAR